MSDFARSPRDTREWFRLLRLMGIILLCMFMYREVINSFFSCFLLIYFSVQYARHGESLGLSSAPPGVVLHDMAKVCVLYEGGLWTTYWIIIFNFTMCRC